MRWYHSIEGNYRTLPSREEETRAPLPPSPGKKETENRVGCLSSSFFSSFPLLPLFSPPSARMRAVLCVPRRAGCCVCLFCPSLWAPSALRLLFSWVIRRSSAKSLAFLSERFIAVWHVISRSSRALRAIFGCGRHCKKTATVGDEYRPALSVVMVTAGARHLPSPSRTRGLFNCSYCVVVLRPQGKLWVVTVPVSCHGRQRPLMTHNHKGNNCSVCHMACFAIRGKGAIWQRTASLLVFLAVGVVWITGQAR